MGAMAILSGLGFDTAAEVNDLGDRIVVRIRTSKGWVYEKFRKASLEADITAWSAGRTPA